MFFISFVFLGISLLGFLIPLLVIGLLVILFTGNWEKFLAELREIYL